MLDHLIKKYVDSKFDVLKVAIKGVDYKEIINSLLNNNLSFKSQSLYIDGYGTNFSNLLI